MTRERVTHLFELYLAGSPEQRVFDVSVFARAFAELTPADQAAWRAEDLWPTVRRIEREERERAARRAARKKANDGHDEG
jgi:hypothetical protein